jgi:hypothetical protein
MLTGLRCWFVKLLDLRRTSSTSRFCILCASSSSCFNCSSDVVVGGAGGNGAGSSAIRCTGDVVT